MPKALNYVGIDLGKDSMHVHVLPADEGHTFANTSAGHKALARYLHSVTPELVVLEATGGLQASAALHLRGEGFAVAVVNPRQVRDFARSTGQLAKTDRLDARIIARFAQEIRPVPRELASQEQRNLAELARRRDDVATMLQAESRRLDTVMDSFCRKDLKQSVRRLERRLEAIDLELRRRIEQNEDWRERYRQLTSVSCVGPRTATVLIALMPELGSASRREIAALAGTAPFSRDSGRYRGQRRIAGGRPEVRRALFMAIVPGICHNRRIAETYARLKARGKKPRVAMVACMRKLLTWLNAMIRDGKEWKHVPVYP